MAGQKRFPWVPVLLGLGCLGALFIGLLLMGGVATFFLADNSISSVIPDDMLNVTINEAEPEKIPARVIIVTPTNETPREEPTLSVQNVRGNLVDETEVVLPTISAPKLTGDQHFDDHSFFDDFSSDALGWAVFNDGKTILEYQNQEYSIQIKELDYYDWALIPVDFIPYEINYDARGPAGLQDGTFGTICQFQDMDNYYYVEFDLDDKAYIIGQKFQGEQIYLTRQGNSDELWQSTSAIKTPPTTTNHFSISCYLDSITLSINNEMISNISIPEPYDQPGQAMLFVYTFDDADENGYTILFDNVEVYQPVQ